MVDGRALRVHVLHRFAGLIEDAQHHVWLQRLVQAVPQLAGLAKLRDQHVLGQTAFGVLCAINERGRHILDNVWMTRHLLVNVDFLDDVVALVLIGPKQPLEGVFCV